ncbi:MULTISPECIES: DUF6527 family protein [Pseudoalteromonas]|jgi:hypothetical protein|uniref:DUF6527 family protein n=2 Tax=Pseudoalteromonas TaxID=53246 RepID=UPI0007322373|nr:MULTISPECIES: DUF6527 family protein [Pseudoalteromonas]KTF18621.1 hypothetical protein ATS76_15910 [Pseudoalteromonas sp. 10-33]
MLRHKFVEFMPDDISPGILYVSMNYGTAIHKCCCGCGEEVVTPFSPTDWKITFDGDNVSLSPSIGNWSFKCQSHYFIRNGRVDWCQSWTKQQVSDNRKEDSLNKQLHFQENKTKEVTAKLGFISWIKRLLRIYK